MSTLNSRLQLSILNRKKNHNLIQKGFTLVELMIVIVVVGILSAVALPQFLGVKDKADLGASIGEQAGLARECATSVLIGTSGPTGCSETGGTFTSIAATANSAGTMCGKDTPTADGKTCIITVDGEGAISYKLST